MGLSTESAVEQTDTLSRYHDYLQKNYVGGCERFFSPTGFLDKFQRTVEIQANRARSHVFVRSADEAASKLQPVVDGAEGVFDLTAEPGTGKTSILPFRFPSKRVIVALPTPFDAWSAFQIATGDCKLKIKGLQLGSNDCNVTYTDSYMAAKALLANYMDYDILIVDECDSTRGVTRFLSEVRAPGKVLIRMSASNGRTQSGTSKSFRVTENDTMPDIRNGVIPVVEFVKKNHKGRSLLLVPDADTALEAASHIPDAVVICTKSNISYIASAVLDQTSSKLYVADDVCARGLNLNLESEFDCQLVAEYGVARVITPAELYQRKGRVGRNKPGFYYSPGLKPAEKRDSDIDVTRNNLIRSIAKIEQYGDSRLHFRDSEALDLMDSPHEPYVELMKVRSADRALASSPESTDSSRPRSMISARSHGSGRSIAVSTDARAPSWLFYYSGSANKDVPGRREVPSDTFITRRKSGNVFVRRRSSGDSDSKYAPVDDDPRAIARSHRRHELASRRHQLPLATEAPYAVKQYRERPQHHAMDLPLSPPVMDLTQLTYDLDWPALIRDRLVKGGDLPTLVPPADWRHTSIGGVGTDWFRRLDDIAVSDTRFDEPELEVVCRAWNKLVAQSWVRKTPGLSEASNYSRLEFCARYFQSYFLLSSAE
nr:TPA_asm: P3 protein [Pecan associated jivivirus 1]